MKPQPLIPNVAAPRGYDRLLADIADIVQAGRRQSAWTVNTIMSAVYWERGAGSSSLSSVAGARRNMASV